MKEFGLKSALAVSIAALGFASTASAEILTFDGNICNGGFACINFASIDQSYGDTAFVDVQTRYDSTGSASSANALQFWNSDYNELSNIAFGTPSSSGASIFFAPIAGYQVTLNSFNLGAWPNRIGAPSQFTIFDGTGATLFSSGLIQVGQLGNLSSFYNVGLTSANGIGLLFGPESYNVGVDNINFTVSSIVSSAVPEPATWAFMIFGFGAIGGAMRRQRKANVKLSYA